MALSFGPSLLFAKFSRENGTISASRNATKMALCKAASRSVRNPAIYNSAKGIGFMRNFKQIKISQKKSRK